jgi:hypothetical protein
MTVNLFYISLPQKSSIRQDLIFPARKAALYNISSMCYNKTMRNAFIFFLLFFFIFTGLSVTPCQAADCKTYVGTVTVLDVTNKQFSIVIKKTAGTMLFKASPKLLAVMKDGDTVRVYVKPGTTRAVKVEVLKRVHAKKQKTGGSLTPFIPPGKTK